MAGTVRNPVACSPWVKPGWAKLALSAGKRPSAPSPRKLMVWRIRTSAVEVPDGASARTLSNLANDSIDPGVCTSFTVMPGTSSPNPSPPGPLGQASSTKVGSFQFCGVPASGIRYFTVALPAISMGLLKAVPKLTSSNWGGNTGANSVETVPSGALSARYSPLALSEKLVCSTAVGMVRFFPDAKTTRKSPGGSVTAGKTHLPIDPAESVSFQPAKFTGESSGLWISIQSGNAPSSSTSLVLLEAMTSEMIGAAGKIVAWPRASKRSPLAFQWSFRKDMEMRRGNVPVLHALVPGSRAAKKTSNERVPQSS